MSGLDADEAREFHRMFVMTFIIFLVVAIIAHILVWQWRPWFPGTGSNVSLIEGVKAAVNEVLPLVYQA